MVEKAQTADNKPGEQTAAQSAAKRPSGHRSSDVRDTVAEMAARAQEISQEAGSKVAQAMKDVINAAAGLAGFAVESARDLVQYMVRRGQMTQEEADRLLREAEEAYSKRKPAVPESRPAPTSEPRKVATPPPAAPKPSTGKPAAAKPTAKKTAPPRAARTPARPAAAKPAARKAKASGSATRKAAAVKSTGAKKKR